MVDSDLEAYVEINLPPLSCIWLGRLPQQQRGKVKLSDYASSSFPPLLAAFSMLCLPPDDTLVPCPQPFLLVPPIWTSIFLWDGVFFLRCIYWLGSGVHTFRPSTGNRRAGGSQFKADLQIEFQSLQSQGYTQKPCL